MIDFLSRFIDWPGALLIILVFLPLERLIPQRRAQRVLRRGWVTDAAYFLLNRIPVGIGLLGFGLFAAVIGELFVPAGFRAMVGAQPIWLQAIAAMLAADLCFYAVHRLFHAVPSLWRFHAIHHSIEELDWLAAHRVHPVDQILTKGASLLPCFALGFSAPALTIGFLFYQWHALLLHANTRIDPGPLGWLIASPRFHHWHHADQPEGWNRNFAGQFPIWDIVFGTAQMRRDAMPDRYGVGDDVPASIGAQMLYPFRRSKEAPADGVDRDRTASVESIGTVA